MTEIFVPFSAKKSVNNLKYNTFTNTSLPFNYSTYNSRRIEFTEEDIFALKVYIKNNICYYSPIDPPSKSMFGDYNIYFALVWSEIII